MRLWCNGSIRPFQGPGVDSNSTRRFLNRPHKPRKGPNYTIILTYATEL